MGGNLQSLSVCMIVRNEEPLIETALKSIKDCSDEIIIVDTGLNDSTKEKLSLFMAKNPDYNIKLFTYEWNDDFSAARNASLMQATKDWILIIDADEHIDSQEVLDLLKVAENNPTLKGFSFMQKTYTNDHSHIGFVEQKTDLKDHDIDVSFAGYTTCYMTRLFKNEESISFENPVHESVKWSIKKSGGQIYNSSVVIHHLKELKGPEWHGATERHYLEIYSKNLDKFANQAKASCESGVLHYAHAKDYPKAIELLEKGLKEYAEIKKKPDPKSVLSLGYAYFMCDEFNDARDVFEKFIRYYPDDANVARAKSAIDMINDNLKR